MARKKIQNAQIENAEPAAPKGAAEVAEVTTPAEPKAICLTPGCGREGKIRALCGRCCTAARKAVKDGKTTWEQLEKLGLAKPAKAGAFGHEKAIFVTALEAALNAKKD